MKSSIKKMLVTGSLVTGSIYVVGLTATFLAMNIKLPQKSQNTNLDEVSVNNVLSKIEDAYTTSLSDVYLGISELIEGKKVTEDELGIEQIEKDDLNVTFQIIEVKKYEAALKMQAIVISGNFKKTKYFNVVGFLGEQAYLTNRANTSLSQIPDVSVTQIKKYTNSIPENPTSWNEMGMSRPQSFFSRFNISFVRNTIDHTYGSATYTITVSTMMSNDELFTQTKDFEVIGYYTDDDDMSYINEVLFDLPYEYSTSHIASKASEIAVIDAKYGIQEMGINIEHDHIVDFIVIFSPKTIDDENGVIIGTLEFGYNGKSNRRSILINGFKTSDQ